MLASDWVPDQPVQDKRRHGPPKSGWTAQWNTRRGTVPFRPWQTWHSTRRHVTIRHTERGRDDKKHTGTQQGLTRLVCSHSETWGAKPLPRTRPKGLFLPIDVHGNPRFAKQEHHCDQAEGSPDTWKPAQDQSTRKWEPRPEWTTQAARCHAVVRERRSGRRQEKETLNHPDYGERAVNL